MNICELKVLNQADPLGIDLNPYFSWIMTGDEKALYQKCYRIIVREGEKEVWDSGVTESPQSTFIPYEGAPLSDCTAYSWRVTVNDNYGNTAEGSASFETAIQGPGGWQAKWIESPFDMKRKGGYGNQPAATVFRRAFQTNAKAIRSARVYATCHGIYELYLNGQRIDGRKFAPENTCYEDYLCYQTYDVTELLLSGKRNCLGMIVGDGWYCGARTKPDVKNYNGKHAALFQLEIRYEDGTRDFVTSDDHTAAGQGAIRANDLYGGEIYDAREDLGDWSSPDYKVSGWKKVLLNDYGYGNLRAQDEEPVRVIETLPCLSKTVSPKGEIILDFGQVLAGTTRVRLDLPKDTGISFEYTEVLDKDGNYFNNMMMNGVDQKVTYISAGHADIFEAHFSFQGFRYVKVSGVSDINTDDIEAVVYSTASADISSFECSDTDVNRLYQNVRWSQKANTISIPTDCPQREKAGWTGDAQVFARTALLNEDGTRFWTRWMRNVSAAQQPSGCIPMVVPMQGIYVPVFKLFGMLFGDKDATPNSAGWSDAAVIIPYRLYEVTGNTEILRM